MAKGCGWDSYAASFCGARVLEDEGLNPQKPKNLVEYQGEGERRRVEKYEYDEGGEEERKGFCLRVSSSYPTIDGSIPIDIFSHRASKRYCTANLSTIPFFSFLIQIDCWICYRSVTS